MPDPGYGPNGERLDATGPITWEAQPPSEPIPEGDDLHGVYPLGVTYVPEIDEAGEPDVDTWTSIYLGGA